MIVVAPRRLLALATCALLAACGGPADHEDPTALAGVDDLSAPEVPADVLDLEGVAASPEEGYDALGPGGFATNVSALTVPSCLTATASTYLGGSIGTQTAPFQIAWDVTPSAANVDAAVAVSKGLATSGWTNLAAIVRFNNVGRIDARNGSAYAAVTTVPYVANATYRVRATVNPSTRRYTVTVAPPGGGEVVVAKDYAFRTEQAAITSVDTSVTASFSGSLRACVVSVAPVTQPAPTPTPTPTPAPTTDPAAPPQPVIPATPVDSTLRTIAGWESLFLGTWNNEHTNDYLPRSTSKNSWRFYNLAYGIDATTAMFEATGKTQYLDRALLYVENVVNSAVRSSSLANSQYKDSYLSWGAWDHPTDPSINGGEYPLYESYCFRYVGKMLRAMRDNPAVYGNATYRAKYDTILAFMKQNVWKKWMARGANAHVYRVNTHMTAHWAFMAVDLWILTADATERAQYKAVLDNINLDLPNYTSSLRGQMRPNATNSAAYFWNSRWSSYATPGQDVSHGNNVIAYLVEANRLGVEWTRTDMLKFVRTLRDHVWKSSGGYAAYVDGSGTGNGWINDGFVKLGRYDVAVQRRLESYTVGRGMQLYGNGALNAKLLNGR